LPGALDCGRWSAAFGSWLGWPHSQLEQRQCHKKQEWWVVVGRAGVEVWKKCNADVQNTKLQSLIDNYDY